MYHWCIYLHVWVNFVNEYIASASSALSPLGFTHNKTLFCQYSYTSRRSSLIESPPSIPGLSRWFLIAPEGSISLQLWLNWRVWVISKHTNHFPNHFKHLQLPLYLLFAHIPVGCYMLLGRFSPVQGSCGIPNAKVLTCAVDYSVISVSGGLKPHLTVLTWLFVQ